ncbi:protein phosphatase 1 regulatory subunit 35 [Leuresthes tenuis]|uniref:protein phosphatase 1 regulatory subunit 35 n=1 Tax=Leuresthes tenuis TaxID=355514 RepID=UPI003B51008F
MAHCQKPVRGPKGSRVCHHAFGHSLEHRVAFSQDQGCLERATLNTTLSLKTELQSLQGAEFNSKKAIEEILQKSERTKSLIGARATEVVNVSPSQLLFTSLVSISVPEDQLISQALQDKLLLTPTSCGPDIKMREAPSLLFLRISDLLREKPLPQEEEPVTSKLSPTACPAFSTFDLYRRRRCWDSFC